MKNSLHWQPSPCIKNDYKIGLWGTLGGCMVCSLVKRVFFRVLRHTEYSWSCTQTLSLYKNASALVVSESEKG